jgi:hypothetical protein
MGYQDEGNQPKVPVGGAVNEDRYHEEFMQEARSNPARQNVNAGPAATFPTPDPDSSDHATNVRNEGQVQSFEDAPPRGSTMVPNSSWRKA